MITRNPYFWLTGGLVVLTGVLAGCNTAPPVAELPPPPVSVSQPLVQDIIDSADYEGRIVAVETLEVRARVRGYMLKVNFKDGQIVKEGEPLFEIDPETYQNALEAANAQMAGAEAARQFAKAEYARILQLFRKNSASREELDLAIAKQATSNADVLKAQAAVDQAQKDLNDTKIAAKIAGKISRPQVTRGNLVNAGGGETLLTTITSVDPIYVYFDVDERAFLGYKEHFRKRTKMTPDQILHAATQVVNACALAAEVLSRQSIAVGPVPSLLGMAESAVTAESADLSVRDLNIPVHVGLEGETGYPHKGVIDFADNHVNPSTGTIQVRGVLPNPQGLLESGMRARVEVPITDPHKALLITERAIGTDQGLKFVYIVTDKNVAERRDVKLGRIHDGLQVILDGLKPEDWIIVNGIQRVRDGAKVEPRQVPMPGAVAQPTKPEPKN
jgi:multidrug efflux pump subunit AcrA (membrane-fusion protein)